MASFEIWSFFCNLDVLYGGLGKVNCNFWSKKNDKNFSAVILFINFWSLKPWIRIGSESVFSLKCWIRIRMKWMRIRNPGYDRNARNQNVQGRSTLFSAGFRIRIDLMRIRIQHFSNCRSWSLPSSKFKWKKNLYTWILIRILNADLDPATQNNADPDPKPLTLCSINYFKMSQKTVVWISHSPHLFLCQFIVQVNRSTEEHGVVWDPSGKKKGKPLLFLEMK